jgi:hypothetical protein
MVYEFTLNDFSDEAQSCIKRLNYGNNVCIIKDGDQEVAAIINMQQYYMLRRIE